MDELGRQFGGLTERVTRLEYESRNNLTREDISNATKEAEARMDKRLNETIEHAFRLQDERLGGTRSSILADMAREHNDLKADLKKFLHDLLHEELPGQVKTALDNIHEEERAAIEAERSRRDAKWIRFGKFMGVLTSVLLFMAAAIGVYWAIYGQEPDAETNRLNKAVSIIDDTLN